MKTLPFSSIADTESSRDVEVTRRHTALRWFQKIRYGVWISAAMVVASPAHAVLDMNGQNRFIFDEGEKRLSIEITNNSQFATLIQTSVTWGDGRQEELPLAVNKPLQVLAPQGIGTIDVFYQGDGFVADRESYILLSVLDVSQAPREPNTMQLALVHQFKLFFRPKFEYTVAQAIKELRWRAHTVGGPTIENVSPYFITLSDIELRVANQSPCGKAIDHVMVAPFSSVTVESAEACQGTLGSVRYDYVTDRGNMRAYEAILSVDEDTLGVAMP